MGRVCRANACGHPTRRPPPWGGGMRVREVCPEARARPPSLPAPPASNTIGFPLLLPPDREDSTLGPRATARRNIRAMPVSRSEALVKGAEFLRYLDRSENEAYAREAIGYLYGLQTEEEKEAGTSLFRNNEGFNKKDAARFADSKPLTRNEVVTMARNYSTQIAAAVCGGKLRHWPQDAKSVTIEECSAQSDEDESEEEDELCEEDGTAPVTVAAACVAYGDCPCLLSRPFVNAVSDTFSKLASSDEGGVPFKPEALLKGVQVTYPGVTDSMVDMAMYQLSPSVAIGPALVGRHVRVLWTEEGATCADALKWHTARVTRITGMQCAPTVSLRFEHDGTCGTVSGTDVSYMYEMVEPRSYGRKRTRKAPIYITDEE